MSTLLHKCTVISDCGQNPANPQVTLLLILQKYDLIIQLKRFSENREIRNPFVTNFDCDHSTEVLLTSCNASINCMH